MKQILDNKNIIDNETLLREKEAEFHGKDDILGMAALTTAKYDSSSRLIMLTNHLKQYVVLDHPEFPRVFTNYENSFGHLSSSIHKAKNNYEVVHKISKFADKPDHLYLLFVYSKEEDKYDVVIKKVAEELTEKFGYTFNNDKLDSLDIGDKIYKGETLWKSSSYDEDDNYCYGVNATVVYMSDTRTIEDAVIVSKSFAKRMTSKKIDPVKISINDNDILCNLYGDSKHYKGLPDIGEYVQDNVIAAKRRIINDQLLFDMKKNNLMHYSPFNDKLYYSDGRVIDIDIYCNKAIDEIEDNDNNAQFLYYLKNQERYYQEIYDYIGKIIKSGSKYSDDIGFLYSRAKNILDPNYKWKDQKNIFSNMIIEITVEKTVGLGRGYKLTGRHGNKGVISTVREVKDNSYISDDVKYNPDGSIKSLPDGVYDLGDYRVRDDAEMPFFIQADGTKKYVDIVFNVLGVPNRLNPGQTAEVEINFIADNIIQKFKTMDTNEEKFEMLTTFLKHFNEKGYCDQVVEYYNSLTDKEKDEFFEDIDKYGIFVHVEPCWDDKPLFDKISDIYDEFPWIQEYQVYFRKWGRDIPIINKMVIGEEYVIKLKQTSKKNFSARSTGYLSQKGLPDKTSKLKNNQQLYSTTPIKLARDENSNLHVGVSPDVVAKLHLFYRSSPIARRQIAKLYTKDVLNFKKFKIKKGYININVKILLVYLKAMGYEIDYGKDKLYIETNDANEFKTFKFKDKYYICTRHEMKEFMLDQKLRHDFMTTGSVKIGTPKDIEKRYQNYKHKIIAKQTYETYIDVGEEEIH